MNVIDGTAAGRVRPCTAADTPGVLQIVNAAAEAYRDVIPPDRWREPYMPADELASEVADGVGFFGWEADGALVGVMGLQRRWNVELIRHAYVLPAWQGRGVGSMILEHLRREQPGTVLVGTWRAAGWAVRFYERHGFARAPDEVVAPLLRTYWSVPERQVATSLVLCSPALDVAGAERLMAEARALAQSHHGPGTALAGRATRPPR